MIPTYYAGGERPLTPDDISQSEAKILGKIIIKSPTIPTASAKELGKVRMFVGETGAVYTHGYIYECVEDNNVYSWERIDVQPHAEIGKYLSSWNCATGLATTNPSESPYIYKTGDYFIVGTIGTTNYKPSGSQYVIGQASSVVETGTVSINDTYLYDGTNWTLLKTGSTVTSVNGQTGSVVTIDDNSTSSLTESWSASKLNATIGNIETILQGI